MTRRVEFVPLLLTETTDIFTIRLNGEDETEFHKFFILFKDTKDKYLKDDLDRIIAAIDKIASNGALENYFRVEGKMKDRVCAIPLLISRRNASEHGTLRLFCLRVSESLIIVGGGGLKLSRTYEQDDNLASVVSLLQAVDEKLVELEKNGINLNEELEQIVVDID